MATILKNTTGSPIIVKSIGQVIAASGQLIVPPDDYDNLSQDATLISKIASGDVVVNDGSQDLSIAYGKQLVLIGVTVDSPGGVTVSFDNNNRVTLDSNGSFSSGKSQLVFQDFLYNTDNSDRSDQGFIGVNNGGSVVLEGGSSILNLIPGQQGAGNDYDGMISLNAVNNGQNPALDSFNKVNKTQLGALAISYEWRVRINNLSDSSNTFIVRLGYQDKVGTSAGRATNNVTFEYTHNVNSGKWTAVCSSNSTSTVLNSNVSLVTNIWTRLRADINSSGTLVTFYIDDISIGTIGTNIPTSKPMRHFAMLERTLGSSGTKTMDIDYVAWRVTR
jgi:hypothetical protein